MSDPRPIYYDVSSNILLNELFSPASLGTSEHRARISAGGSEPPGKVEAKGGDSAGERGRWPRAAEQIAADGPAQPFSRLLLSEGLWFLGRSSTWVAPAAEFSRYAAEIMTILKSTQICIQGS